MCEICCEFFIFHQMSAHSLRVSRFWLLNWETPTFILSRLWLAHPDLNSMYYKICTEIQQQTCLLKIYNVNGPTLWHGFKRHIVMNNNNNNNNNTKIYNAHSMNRRRGNNAITKQTIVVWTSLSVCKMTTLLIFSLFTESTFVHFNVLVCWELQVTWCYRFKFYHLWFFTFHKVV